MSQLEKSSPQNSAISEAAPSRTLGLFDCIGVMVGIIIGSAIYELTPLMLSNSMVLAKYVIDWGWVQPTDDIVQYLPAISLIIVWLISAGIALCGACTYAELASTYPHVGGDYEYLKRAYHPNIGVLFVWSEFWVVRPANVGFVTLVFAKYFSRIVGWEDTQFGVIAGIVALAILVGINLWGARGGVYLQNALACAKVTGLVLIALAGFLLPDQSGIDQPLVEPTSIGGSFALAIVFALFALGGWNDLAFVAGEVRDPKKTIGKALIMGIAVVTTIYILISLSLVYGLGAVNMASSQAAAADLMQSRVGDWGARIISVLVCLSALGAMNGMTFAGARIYYAMGCEHKIFQFLGYWNAKFGGPVRAMLIQFCVTTGIILCFGFVPRGIERLVNFSTTFFWIFFLLSGVSVYVLRYRDKTTERPFRVPGYPITPAIFILACAYVLYSSTTYAISQGGREWLWAAIVALSGLFVIIKPYSKPKKELKHRLVAGVARLIILFALVPTIAAIIPYVWPLELASHFPLVYFVGATIGGLLGLILRIRLIYGVAAVVMVWNLSVMVPEPIPSPEIKNPESWKIVSINVLYNNREYQAVADFVREENPDVVAFEEVTSAWANELRQRLPEWKFVALEPRESAAGLIVLSRHPMESQTIETAQGMLPQIDAKITRGDSQIRLLACHIYPPVSSEMLADRNADLNELGKRVSDTKLPTFVIGDFNITPWSPAFNEFLRDTKFRDSRVGFGLQNSWPAFIPWIKIPIDHCFVNNQVAVKQRKIGSYVGSDHLPIVLEVEVEKVNSDSMLVP